MQQQEPRKAMQLYLSMPIVAWALFDLANTIFSSNINTIFFPFYMNDTLGTDEVKQQVASTFISYANAVASILLVICSPLYGVLVDRTGLKKRYTMYFTLFSVGFTILMGVFGKISFDSALFGVPMSLALVVIAYVFAKFFYNSSLVFYDSMLPDLGNDKEIPLISGYGVALGGVGTLIGLLVYPISIKWSNVDTFIPTALLFLLFSLPLFFILKDKPKPKVERIPFFTGYKDIVVTLKDMKKHKAIFTFMIAYFFLNDALQTAIAMMAVYATIVVGFTSGQFILLYLVSTISMIIGSLVFGNITRAAGAKRAVTFVCFIMIAALFIAVFAQEQWMFWIAGSLFGVSLGSTWVTSRTFIIQLSPPEKTGQFFGLFAFSGKVSSIVGPALYGTITLMLKNYGTLASRVALGSLLVLTIIGLIVHLFVRVPKSTKSATIES